MMFEKDQVSDQKEISCEEISEKLQLNKNIILILNKNICSAVGKTMPNRFNLAVLTTCTYCWFALTMCQIIIIYVSNIQAVSLFEISVLSFVSFFKCPNGTNTPALGLFQIYIGN